MSWEEIAPGKSWELGKWVICRREDIDTYDLFYFGNWEGEFDTLEDAQHHTGRENDDE